MPPRIFIVGALGYVGGDLTALLIQNHPNYQLSALVRNSTQAESLQTLFPNVQPIIGSFDSRNILIEEAKRADVIVQVANADDELVTFTLLEGAAQNINHPTTYIHISGQANLIDFQFPLGKAQDKIFGDVENAAEILSLPAHNIHAAIEQKLILKAESLGVRAAIVSLPIVYGTSRGPKPQNQLFKFYTNAVIAHGRPFVVDAGQNLYTYSHVSDAASAIETVVMEALKSANGHATWGKDGYYFVGSLEEPFSLHANLVGEVLLSHNLIKSGVIDHLTGTDVDAIWNLGRFLWGSSMRSRSQKLKALGWKPNVTTRAADLRAMTEYEVSHRDAA
jgi:nucleoside-diphosphate-sugar epimerase